MENWIIFSVGLLLIAAMVIYYFLSGKKRRQPYYREKENWRKKSPTDMEIIRHSVFLIGDAGAPSLIHPDQNLELLRALILKAGKNSSLIFLGDNIYPKGMPRPNEPLHEVSEKRLLRQLKITDGYEGRVCFISGNHDWNKGRKGGYESVRRQQFYVESYFQRQDVFLPRNGCPGPVEISVNNHLTIIIINSQWWVHGEKVPLGKENGCDVESEHEFFVRLSALLDKNKNKRILVVAHHPLYSQAYHGGSFSMKQHLFPLTDVHKKLYVPLPVAGSIYPIYRKYIGAKEDMSHPKYRNLRKRLLEIFKPYENLIYVSGHDHNLQYIKKRNQHFIISGAGCKTAYVQSGGGARFTHAHKGFARLDFYYNGDVWLEFWEPFDEGEGGVLTYKTQLINSNE